MQTEVIFTVVVILMGLLAAGAFFRLSRSRSAESGELAQVAQTTSALGAAQRELAGRLTQLAEESRASQAALTKALEERFDKVSHRLGQSLEDSTAKTTRTLGDLQTRLTVIDEAQKRIAELSGQVVGLQDILSNKQARGAFGEIQLNDLVINALPPSAYEFQATLAGNRRADCLIKLPNPPGPIVIDAKFPLESYHALRDASDESAHVQAARSFSTDILKHVHDIAERYIVPGETAESALMFLPSEAVYAELHANFPDVVEKSFRQKVWIVSPTTLMATLNTVRAVLKDARMREQAGVIQAEVMTLLDDVGRLDKRIGNLRNHFRQADEDIRQVEISSAKITRRAERIEEVQLGEDGEPDQSELLAPREKLAAK